MLRQGTRVLPNVEHGASVLPPQSKTDFVQSTFSRNFTFEVYRETQPFDVRMVNESFGVGRSFWSKCQDGTIVL
jgi:hypothetical protein